MPRTSRRSASGCWSAATRAPTPSSTSACSGAFWNTPGRPRPTPVYCEGRLDELFAVDDGPPARVVAHRATRRAYGRHLLARGRLVPSGTTGPSERCIEEYGVFLREVRGLAATTTATHQATASDFLARALHPMLTPDALNAAHVERYVAKKGAEVTRQTLQHTVAHLRAFLRYCFDRGLIPERLYAMDTPRTYRGEQPPRASRACR